MFNLIRSDWYRMTRSTSLYAVVFSISFIITFDLYAAITGANFLPVKLIEQTGFISSGMTLFFIAIFMSIFITSEYRDGYIKNIAGIVTDRTMLVVSKLVVSCIAVLIMFTLNIIFTLSADMIFLYKNSLLSFEGITLSRVALFFASQFIYYIVLLTIVMFFSMLTRSNAMGCIISFSLGTRLISELLTMLWEYLAEKQIVSDKINIADYFITSYMQQTWIGSDQAMIFKGIIVAAVYFVIFITLTIFTVKKRDI